MLERAATREALPGLVWISPEQPFHVPIAPKVVAIDGATLLLGGRHGWVARFDTATGTMVRERRFRATS